MVKTRVYINHNEVILLSFHQSLHIFILFYICLPFPFAYYTPVLTKERHTSQKIPIIHSLRTPNSLCIWLSVHPILCPSYCIRCCIDPKRISELFYPNSETTIARACRAAYTLIRKVAITTLDHSSICGCFPAGINILLLPQLYELINVTIKTFQTGVYMISKIDRPAKRRVDRGMWDTLYLLYRHICKLSIEWCLAQTI